MALIVCLLPLSTMAQLRTPENVPIAFYGKVVDQSGQPVEGAKISALVVVSHIEQYDTEMHPVTSETDQNGNFILTGYTAYGIDKISVEKEGYELSEKTILSYTFGGTPTYTPDRNNPVVFQMWKKIGKEPLVGSAWRGKVVCDGTVNRFDLFTGHPSAEGNLEIQCTRVPLDLPAGNTEPFTWELQIKILGGGGIQPANDEFTYRAPAAGYLPVLTYGQKAGDPKWDRRMPMPKEYYIKTSDGQHGTFSLEWDRAFWKSPTILKWDCSINPTGSRNLER
jgi:hypothetical protein